MQIHPGHIIFESVKSALMDSVGQVLLVSPYFGFLEGLWFVNIVSELKIKFLKLVGENKKDMCETGKVIHWC